MQKTYQFSLKKVLQGTRDIQKICAQKESLQKFLEALDNLSYEKNGMIVRVQVQNFLNSIGIDDKGHDEYREIQNKIDDIFINS